MDNPYAPPLEASGDNRPKPVFPLLQAFLMLGVVLAGTVIGLAILFAVLAVALFFFGP